MTDWNPQVVIIEKISQHYNADALEVAHVMGDYPVIINKGQFKVGDIAAYIPIDSIVPDTDQFYFLCPMDYRQEEAEDGSIKNVPNGPRYAMGFVPEKYRVIKAKKIREVYSQGMLMEMGNSNLNVGDSIVEYFGLKKLEEIEEENIIIRGARKNIGDCESPPKFSLPYYDIVSVRGNLRCLEGREVVLTEKLHGSNGAFVHDGNRLWVKSRKLFKKEDEGCMWWAAAKRLGLEDKLSKYPMFAFFGEVYGQIKGFKYDAEIKNGKLEYGLRFFDIWDIKEQKWVMYDRFEEICNESSLSIVPFLFRGEWGNKEEMYKYAKGKSTLNNKHVREGFVVKTLDEPRYQFKLVGEGYNLQK